VVRGATPGVDRGAGGAGRAHLEEAVGYGTLTDPPRLDPQLMFEDVFKEMPEHLRRQSAELRDEMAGN
jgi:hypothetical protein